MLSKLLGNKLVVMGIIVVAVIVVIALTNIGKENNDDFDLEESSVEKSDNCNEIKNDYEKLECKIEKYEKKEKWNTTDYSLISKNIQGYVDDGKIDDEQKTKLMDLLKGKHLLLLNDTVKNFCEKVERKYFFKRNSIAAFESEVDKFSDALSIKVIIELLEKYKVLRAKIYAINYYTSKKEYKKYTFESYQSSVKDYEFIEPFASNEHLQNVIKYGVAKLQKHKAADIDFQDKELVEFCDCEEKFKNFEFYIKACKKLQESTKK